MGTRQDWRELLEKFHRELGFQYVRFHGLLNDEMSVVKRKQDGSLRYSFFNIDSIFDFLLSIGIWNHHLFSLQGQYHPARRL
jgi:xylan 1,4-beta-xylosidase